MNGRKIAIETFDALDPTDLAILSILQTEGRLGVTEIGRRISLSQPAVSARIRRLERAGIITGFRAVVEPRRLGSTSTPSSGCGPRTPGSRPRSTTSPPCRRSSAFTG